MEQIDQNKLKAYAKSRRASESPNLPIIFEVQEELDCYFRVRFISNK
jgi:hypothetical protein